MRIDFNDYLTRAFRHQPHLRRGQAAFNTLWEERPDLAELVRGSDIDPYYRDELLDRFILWVEASWDEPQRIG